MEKGRGSATAARSETMSIFRQELVSDRARVRFDIVGGPARERLVDDDVFLNYRLGSDQR